jgi:hypothetical protein
LKLFLKSQAYYLIKKNYSKITHGFIQKNNKNLHILYDWRFN